MYKQKHERNEVTEEIMILLLRNKRDYSFVKLGIMTGRSRSRVKVGEVVQGHDKSNRERSMTKVSHYILQTVISH